MNVRKIKLSFEAVALSKTGRLVGTRTLHPYVNGSYTQDILGAEYEVVLENLASEKIFVKIENGAPPIISEEEIKPTDRIEVSFTDFVGTYYTTRDGKGDLSARAKGITIVTPTPNKV